MSIARKRRALFRWSMAAAAFLVASGISAGDGAPPEEPLLSFSTYLGRSGINDEANAAAFAPDGTLWIAATVSANDFPGAPRTPPSPFGDSDVVVVHFDPATQSVLSTARMAGTSNETPVAIAVNAAGDAFVAGSAMPRPAGGDLFVARLFHDGSGFAWTYAFGGLGGIDSLAGMCLTADGDPVVAGSTYSPSFPVYAALYPLWRGGTSDAFVARLHANGTGFVFSTFLGGKQEDVATSICRAPNGGLVIAGTTRSAEFVTTTNPIVGVPVNPSLDYETFLAEIDASGTQLRRVAGLGATSVQSVSATPDSLVLAGYAAGGMPFPAPHPATGSERFGLLLRLDATTWNPAGGTFLMETLSEHPFATAIGPDGTVWTAFRTASASALPVPGAVRPLPRSPEDAYVAAFDPADFTQVFGTYLGGDGSDLANAVAVGPDGRAWVAGRTSSTDFPTVHPLQPWFGSGDWGVSELFFAALSAGDPALRPAAVVTAGATAIDGHSVHVTWTPGDGAATAFAIDRAELSPATVGWSRVAVVQVNAQEWFDTSVKVDRTYRYAVHAFNGAGGSPVSAPVVATTPATLEFTIRQGTVAYSFGRPRGARHRGDLVRIRGKLARLDPAAGALDLASDGLVLIGGDADQGTRVLVIQSGVAGAWRVRRNGVQAWRDGSTRIDYDPATGALDLRFETSNADSMQTLTDPGFGRTEFRLEVGREAGSTVPLWRQIVRKRPPNRGNVIGVRLP